LIIDKHPYYDEAYRWLPENHLLRFQLSRNSVPQESIPLNKITERLKKGRKDNSIYFRAKPGFKTSEYVRTEGSLSHNSNLNYTNRNHPIQRNGLYRVPLIMGHIRNLIYFLQLVNDPMHILSNIIDGILSALNGDCISPFNLKNKYIQFFDSLCSSLVLPSQYSIPNSPLSKSCHTKSGDKFTLCSEIFIFLLSSTLTPTHDSVHPSQASLYGLVISLHRLMSSKHTIKSLDELEQQLAFHIALLQYRDEFKTFKFINFHLGK
jgi:hypothetical protein